jgi:hypothetical protein
MRSLVSYGVGLSRGITKHTVNIVLLVAQNLNVHALAYPRRVPGEVASEKFRRRRLVHHLCVNGAVAVLFSTRNLATEQEGDWLGLLINKAACVLRGLWRRRVCDGCDSWFSPLGGKKCVDNRPRNLNTTRSVQVVGVIPCSRDPRIDSRRWSVWVVL